MAFQLYIGAGRCAALDLSWGHCVSMNIGGVVLGRPELEKNAFPLAPEVCGSDVVLWRTQKRGRRAQLIVSMSPLGLSLGVVAYPRSPFPFRPSKSLQLHQDICSQLPVAP